MWQESYLGVSHPKILQLMFKNVRLNWAATWNPDMYHGWGKEKNFFEGWYFKWVSTDEKTVLAIIPGISKGANGDQHAFVQVFDGVACKAWYHRFEAAEFQPDHDRFELNLGNNFFSANRVELDLPNLRGEIQNGTTTSLAQNARSSRYYGLVFIRTIYAVLSRSR